MDGSVGGRTRNPERIVSVRHLSCCLGGVEILRDIDLDIAKGEFVALLGRSGSGKTTLLRTLAGLEAITGAASAEIARNRAVVFQDARLLPWKRVWQNVVLGLKVRDPRKVAYDALVEVQLHHRQDAWPLTLSGGEAQRAALARALVRDPDLLLLDEPFAALDALTRLKMHDLVRELWSKRGPGVLLVTHDIDEAIKLADRILILDQGRFVGEVRPTTSLAERHREADGLRQRLLEHMADGAVSTTSA